MDSKVPRDNDQLDKHSYINIDGMKRLVIMLKSFQISYS